MAKPDPYLQALFGAQAQHVAFNYVVQRGEGNCAPIVGNTSHALDMTFGSLNDGTHVLVLCDAIVRPRLVIASDHLQGMGLTGIIKDGIASVDDWLRHGKIIINNMPGPAGELRTRKT